MNIKGIFDVFARAFEKKIDNDYHIKLQFEIYDMENDIWQVEVKNGKVSLFNEEKIKPEGDVYILSRATLEKLYNNKLSPLSAFLEQPEKAEKGELVALITGKHRMEMGKIPREKALLNYQNNKDYWDRLNKFHEFFSKDYPTKVIVNNKNCVKHNGDIDTIGLPTNGKEIYGQIFVSIKKGEVLNYPPCEFYVYIISGKGKIILGDEACEIKEKEFYPINAFGNAQIKNIEEESLDILVLLSQIK
jgi:mannose-6-phosphate isomerase-like protein (cupin superfamily)/putative sterol carrier protein